MKIKYDGIMENVVTFLKSGDMSVGDLVKVSANDTVKKCESTDLFDGVVVNADDETAAVQLSGFAVVPADSALTTGRKLLAVNSAGKLAVASGGRECTVVNCDTTAGTATIYFS